MRITHEQIEAMVKNHPNDAELGRSIRELIFKAQNANEVYISPNQRTIYDAMVDNEVINEVTSNGNGLRY